MPLEFESKLTDSLPLELAALRPDVLVGATLDQIRRVTLPHGNRPVEVGEVFKITGSNDSQWRFTTPLPAACGLATGLTAGEIVVTGDIGPRCGHALRGGAVRIHGSAGDWLGAELRGCVIEVHGDAGRGAGAALPGAPRGMRGGVLLIHGSTGSYAGAAMRRGLLGIGGDCGELVGYQMRAGSIVVFGACGANPGVSMRRGTIALLGVRPPELPPLFARACEFTPPALPLMLAELQRWEFPPARTAKSGPMTIYNAERGELWTRR